MNVKDIINKIKEFISKKILDFKALSKTKKLALVIASVAVILSIVFGVKYMNNKKIGTAFFCIPSIHLLCILLKPYFSGSSPLAIMQ